MTTWTFLHGAPRRRPYPYDAIFSGLGVLLGKGDPKDPESGLVAVRPKDLSSVAPADFTYSAQNPELQRMQPWDEMGLGLGLKTQSGFADRRYKYTINADLSAGVWQKGPLITTYVPQTVDSTNGIVRFWEQNGKLYALNGRYALVQNSDTSWTVSQDFGAGNAGVDAVAFYSNALSTSMAWVAMGDTTNFWYFDSTTWTQSTMTARAWGVVGREFYRATGGNTLAKCDTNSDPRTSASWGAYNQFVVGDKASVITRLATTAAGTLLVVKTDGGYTVDDSGQDHPLWPHLKFAPDPTAGQGLGSFLNDLYLPFRNGLFKVRPDYTIEEIGPERITSNDSPVRGAVTAFQGDGTFGAYAAIWNGDTTTSYLLKFGAWLVPSESPQFRGPQFIGQRDAPAVRVDGWHGSISPGYVGAQKKIQTLYKSAVGAPAGHARLYLGFADGTIGWFTLPCTPNPSACTQYRYTLQDGEVNLPTWTGQFANDAKAMVSFTVNGSNLNPQNYVQLQYQIDPAVGYQSLTTSGSAFNWDAVRKRGEFPAATSGTLIDVKVVLKNTATTASPLITGVGLGYILRIDLLRMVYEFTVLASDGLMKRDGRPFRVGAQRVRDVVRAAVQSPGGGVTVTLPNEERKQLAIVGYEEKTAWDDRTRKWHAALLVRAIEVRTEQQYGTIKRMVAYRIGDLAPFTIGQLKNL